MQSASADRLIFARNPAGDPIAECELAAGDVGLLPGLAEEAAAHGCVLLWVHSAADLSSAGFTPQQGYRRFTAASVRPGDRLPLLDTTTVLDTTTALGLLPRVFTGQWGHHLFDPAWAGSAGARYVGLGRPGRWSGLCRFEPENRYIDGPGFVAGAGTQAQASQLVAAAAGHLGPGPVTLETWGDPPGAYLHLGFEIAEECGGWERVITPAER